MSRRYNVDYKCKVKYQAYFRIEAEKPGGGGTKSLFKVIEVIVCKQEKFVTNMMGWKIHMQKALNEKECKETIGLGRCLMGKVFAERA